MVYVFIHQFGMFPLISGAAARQQHAWLYFLVPIFVLGTASVVHRAVELTETHAWAELPLPAAG